MLEMRKEADRRHRHWQDVLEEVKKDLTHAEMRLAGQVSQRGRAKKRCGDGDRNGMLFRHREPFLPELTWHLNVVVVV